MEEGERDRDVEKEIKDMCLENIPELPKLLIIQLFMGFWLGGKFFNIFMALSYKFFIITAEEQRKEHLADTFTFKVCRGPLKKYVMIHLMQVNCL